MKKLLLTILTVLYMGTVNVTVQGHTINLENEVSSTFKNVVIKMPNIREINSGSKIIVTYSDDVPYALQNAFDYAARIWEEQLPECMPINIAVSVGHMSFNTLSTISYRAYEFDGHRVNNITSPTAMVKSVLLKEFNYGQQHRYIDEINPENQQYPTTIITWEDLMNGTDIKITYNRHLLNMMNFDLDESLSAGKFDFVTLALRDMTSGFGFNVDFDGNNSSKTLQFPTRRPTAFESIVIDALGTNDPSIAYTKATSDSVNLTIRNYFDGGDYSLDLYAPSTWNKGKSLSTFYPSTQHPITQLLSYEFGPGYIMRDLTTNKSWDSMFYAALDWRNDIATGPPTSTNKESGSSDMTIPFEGTFSFGTSNNSNLNAQSTRETTSSKIARTLLNEDPHIYPYSYHYSAFYRSVDHITVGALLKDGTWDLLYDQATDWSTTELNVSELIMHYPEESYARGTTGGLRYRLVTAKPNGFYNAYTSVLYYTRDYPPATPKIRFEGNLVAPQREPYEFSTLSNTDDYFIDVEVGLKDIDGATRVVVEQLDEGDIVSFSYEVTDFNKGYFVANLDRELSTQLTVISSNKHGVKRSNVITIPPIGYADRALAFNRTNDNIHISGLSSRALDQKNIICEISNLMLNSVSTPILIDSTGTINVSDLSKGMYVLIVRYGNQMLGTYKFTK